MSNEEDKKSEKDSLENIILESMSINLLKYADEVEAALRKEKDGPSALERNTGFSGENDIRYSKNNNWQEVKKYKKPKKNVTLKKAWKGFVIGLCFAGLGVSMKIAYDIGKSLEENPIENNSDTDPNAKKLKPNEQAAKSYFFQYKDQEYLNLITNGTHEEWETLPENIKDWIRDPDKVKEAEERRKTMESGYTQETETSSTTPVQNETQESNIVVLNDDDFIVESESNYNLEAENEPEFEITIEDSYVYNPDENSENIIIYYDSDNERE